MIRSVSNYLYGDDNITLSWYLYTNAAYEGVTHHTKALLSIEVHKR